jgi:hypothetical protein
MTMRLLCRLSPKLRRLSPAGSEYGSRGFDALIRHYIRTGE